MTRNPQQFILADGTIDMRAARKAAVDARSNALRNIFFWRSERRS